MSYKHLTINEREMLLYLKGKGLSLCAIALYMHRNVSTISRECHRCDNKYSPHEAQINYENKRKHCHKPLLLDLHLQLRCKIVHYILDLHWSPEQITQRFHKEGQWCVSSNTIYRHIYYHNLGQTFLPKVMLEFKNI